MIHETIKDDAVSPVVGVMLMIIVTVVIAAVITGFATGIIGGDDTSVSSTAMIELDDTSIKSNLLYTVDFVHRGGDAIPLDDIEITFFSRSKQSITNYFPGYLGTLTVPGKSGSDVILGVGDVMKITITGYSHENAKYESGDKVIWTVYNKRTDAVLADGVLIVPYE